jgi:two-component system sensor kinase FixL
MPPSGTIAAGASNVEKMTVAADGRADGRSLMEASPAGVVWALLQSSALVALYLVLEWVSFLHEHNNFPVTPWNPGLGLMFAMIMLRGWKVGLALFAGVVLAQWIVVKSDATPVVSIAIGAIMAGTYTSVAVLVGRTLDLGPGLLRTRDVLYLVSAGVAGALAVSLQLWLVLLWTARFQFSDIASTYLPLILGDAIGIAVVTPLLLLAGRYRWSPRALVTTFWLEIAAICLAITIVLLLLFYPLGHGGPSYFYLLFVPVVIAAVRYGMGGACASLALTQLGLVVMLHWHGFDLSRFTEYQVLMLVLTVTGLVVGGLVDERTAADHEAETARRRLQDLEAQSARIARLNLASGMAAALAHEINQPMTAARALGRSVEELLRAPDVDTPRIARNLSSMISQIDHASEVVKQMREFVRRGAPRVSQLDMREVLTDAVALADPLVKSNGIRIAIDAPHDLPSVLGDRVQIQQVVINLVKNAFDAISESETRAGRIAVTARRSSDERAVEVAVIDDGPGIADAQREALFEPLNTSREEGLGLGLSICKTIVRAHSGSIWLSASEPGRTEFRFSIPAQDGSQHHDT